MYSHLLRQNPANPPTHLGWSVLGDEAKARADEITIRPCRFFLHILRAMKSTKWPWKSHNLTIMSFSIIFRCFCSMVSPRYSTTLWSTSQLQLSLNPHLPPKGPSPSAPPPVVPHALWQCGCHLWPRARRNLMRRSGGWRVGIRGSQQKGYDQTKRNKKYMFGGWMIQSWVFFATGSPFKVMWLSWNILSLSDIGVFFTHFHKEKSSYSHVYLAWQLLTSDFGDSAANKSDRKVKVFLEKTHGCLEWLSRNRQE